MRQPTALHGEGAEEAGAGRADLVAGPAADPAALGPVSAANAHAASPMPAGHQPVVMTSGDDLGRGQVWQVLRLDSAANAHPASLLPSAGHQQVAMTSGNDLGGARSGVPG